MSRKIDLMWLAQTMKRRLAIRCATYNSKKDEKEFEFDGLTEHTVTSEVEAFLNGAGYYVDREEPYTKGSKKMDIFASDPILYDESYCIEVKALYEGADNRLYSNRFLEKAEIIKDFKNLSQKEKYRKAVIWVVFSSQRKPENENDVKMQGPISAVTAAYHIEEKHIEGKHKFSWNGWATLDLESCCKYKNNWRYIHIYCFEPKSEK